MPPLSSGQKGPGKKGGAGAMRHQQRSRNTTPISVAAAAAAAAAAASSAASAAASSPAGSRASPTSALPASQVFEPESVEGVKFDMMERNLGYEDLVDAAATGAALPDSKSLDSMISKLQTLGDMIDRRGTNSDRAMRLLAQGRKLRQEDDMAAAAANIDEDGGAGGSGSHVKKQNKKKRKGAPDSLAVGHGGNTERTSPMRDGGNSSKPAKGSQENESTSSSLSPPSARTPNDMDIDDKAKAQVGGAGGKTRKKDAKQKKGKAKADSGSEEDSESSSDEEKPKPRERPQANTFGEDPSTFPDPTLYEVLPVKPGMAEDEIKKIYSVTRYPKNDLSDRIAGDPPDKDFSNAKPSNQINFSTFSTFTDPYFRPFTEEDLGFLRERGDRVTPFIMPRRGKKHYTETWAEEDGVSAMDIDSDPADRAPQNQPRGSIENMNDEVAEMGGVSTGPLLERLLAAMRPEHRPVPAENGANTEGDGRNANGATAFDFSFSDGGQSQQATGANGAANGSHTIEGEEQQALPPATYMPECESDAWRKANHPKLDYSQVDERIRQELRHIGFLPSDPDPVPGAVSGGSIHAAASGASGSGTGSMPPPSAGGGVANSSAAMLGGGGASSSSTAGGNASDGNPAAADYDGHYDDEVAARLRLLQARLREQVLLNGARKARVAELVKERMAHQEYQTILEDLDSQVNSSYLKRTRTMGKKPKKSRAAPASAGAGGGNAAGGAGDAGAGGASSLPGGNSATGTARPGIGDAARTLMDRRRRWIDNIGTVFDDVGPGGVRVPRAAEHPESSIFKPEIMADLVRQEKVAWDEEVEEE